MRSVEEIKADTDRLDSLIARYTADGFPVRHFEFQKARCETELRAALTADIPLDRLEALCAAEREGRCVVLPAMDKTIVHCINGLGGVYDCYVNGIMCLRDRDGPLMRATAKLSDGTIYEHCVVRENIGKTVFLTRAEAEAALRQKGATDEL